MSRPSSSAATRIESRIRAVELHHPTAPVIEMRRPKRRRTDATRVHGFRNLRVG